MFHCTLNDLQVELELRPTSPLLIKDGRHFERKEGETGEVWKERVFFHRSVPRTPSRPRKKQERGYGSYDNADDCFDMACVYTRDAQGMDRFYLPGSSLRGLLRTMAERIVGRWRPDLARASDPFHNAAEHWTQQQRDIKQSPGSKAIYYTAGPLDRCFGHTALRGRWSVADAWMQNDQEASVIVRDGVGINRATGAAQNDVKFQFEAITGGVFSTTLTLVNYELWQLGLLAHVLAALDGGAIRLGYGTRRGMGRVQVHVAKMAWHWYQKGQPEQANSQNGKITKVTIPTLAKLAQVQGLSGAYGWRDEGLSSPTLPLEQQRNGGLVADWVLSFPNEPTNWEGDPWPAFGPLLKQVLTAWPEVQADKQEVPA